MTPDGPRWLTPQEQVAWRSYLRGVQRLDLALDKDLQAHGLSLSEYEVLAVLSEVEAGGSLRMSCLADQIVQSRSRLTHTANRLEARGLVRRVDCADDRRGVNLALTDKGYETVRATAHVHVESVRRHLLDLMSSEEFLVLGELMGRVNEQARSRGRSVVRAR